MPLIGSPSFRIRPEWLWQELGHATDRLRQLGLRWPGLLRLEEIVLLWLDLVEQWRLRPRHPASDALLDFLLRTALNRKITQGVFH